MKFLRFLLITLVAGLAALGIALAVALDAGVQTWVARRAMADGGVRPGSVGSVAMGFSTTELKRLTFSSHGAVLTLPKVQAEFPPLAAWLSHKLLVRRLTAKGWTLDLRAATGALAGGGALRAIEEPFRGIFSRFVLPLDLALAAVELEGDVLLPASPGVPEATVHVMITGGGLGAGQNGQFVFRLSAAPNGPAVVSRLSAEGVLSAGMDSPRTFTRFGLRCNAAAYGRKLGQGVRLVADLSAARAAQGESYSLVLSGETKPLVAVLADVPGDGQRPAGTWRLDVADEDLSPFLLGRILPNFDLVGGGQFDADARGVDLHLSGGLKANLDRLDAIRPRLAPIGAVGLLADFDLTRRGNLWRVDRLSAAVQGAQPIFTVRSLQPFGFDSSSGELQVANASGDLAGLTLQALPPSWVRIFFPNLDLSGNPLRGELVGSAHNGAVSLRSIGSLSVSGVSAHFGGRPLVQNLNATFSAVGDYTPGGWQLQVNSLSVAQGDTHLLDGGAKFGRRTAGGEPVKLEGAAQIDLAALAEQPVAVSLTNVRTGSAAVNFSASLGAAQALEARVRLSRVTAEAQPETLILPDITADLRADFTSDHRLTFRAPIRLAKAGRISNVVLEGAFGGDVSHPVLEGTLSGARLAIEDAAVLGAPFAGGAQAGLRAKVKLALQRVDWTDYALTGVEGELRCAGGAVELSVVKARLSDAGPISLSAELERTAGAASPCRWNAAATVSDVEVSAWWRKFTPDRAPPFEGKFKLDGRFSGQGADWAAAWSAAHGTCAATSTGGTFRILATEVAPKASGGNIAMNALRSVASTVGSVIGRHKNGEFANPADAVIYAAQAVSAIAYDQLSFTVERGSGRDVRCRDFALISPEIRLSGQGRIAFEAGTPFDEEPLTAQLNLSARGKLAAALKYLDVLGAKPDDLGYAACPPPITVKGTLQKPDTSEMQAWLMKIVNARGGDLLNKLLGK
jgi:hypothetical protein